MTKISTEELGHYFDLRDKVFHTSSGLLIHYTSEEVSSQYDFSDDVTDFSFSLFTEGENLQTFIEGYRLKNLEDIEALGYNDIWIRYLNREADMEVTQLEMEEGPLKFRLHNMKTIVFSPSLHFYDEVYKHLTLPEDFMSYFIENESKLHVAMGNRYKF